MMRFYILIGQTPVPEPDIIAWAACFGDEDRVVFQTEFAGGRVSTVFLGLDHQWGIGPPLLFETMVFLDGEPAGRERCSTWLEAEAQHTKILEKYVHEDSHR